MKPYNEFRLEYEEQHPASIPQPEVYINEYPYWITGAVGAMFIASAFFSGVHTVPIAHDAVDAAKVAEGLRQAAGISAFVFVESGVLISAYMLVKRWSLVMFAILIITISVAMGANLYSVAQALQSSMTDTFTKVITILFGVVAPLMAGLSGGVFVWLHQSNRSADVRVQAKFKERSIAWDKEVKREYEKYKKIVGEAEKRLFADQIDANKQPNKGAAKQTTQTNSPKQRALDFMANNPGKQFTVRSLAEAAGVSTDAAYKAMQLKANGHNTSEQRLQ